MKSFELIRAFSLFTICLLTACQWSRGASPEIGVLVANPQFRKELIFSDRRLGKITDLKIIKPSSDGYAQVGVAGNYGATIIDDGSKVLKFIKLGLDPKNYGRTDFQFIDLLGDGKYQLLSQAGAAHHPVSVWDEAGMLWSYKRGRNSIPADLDGDGKLEFVLPTMNAVLVLNFQGKLIARWPEKRSDTVQVAKNHESGKLEIFTSSQQPNQILVRDVDGTVTRKISLNVKYISEFYLFRYPKPNSNYRLFAFEENGLSTFDPDNGNLIETLPIQYLVDLKTVHVRFSEHEPDYFVVIGQQLYQGGQIVGLAGVFTNMYVFDANQKLVYHEVFPDADSGNALLAIFSGPNGKETLLVGGTNNVYRYSMQYVKVGKNAEGIHAGQR